MAHQFPFNALLESVVGSLITQPKNVVGFVSHLHESLFTLNSLSVALLILPWLCRAKDISDTILNAVLPSVVVDSDSGPYQLVRDWVQQQPWTNSLWHVLCTRYKNQFLYEPYEGWAIFWHGGRPFIYRSWEETTQKTKTMFSRIYTLPFSNDCVKLLLEEMKAWEDKKNAQKTIIYTPERDPEWRRRGHWSQMQKESRQLDTIYLPERMLSGILEDLKKFLSRQRKDWYRDTGIPYRRGYLFHGIPGSGKSTLAFILGGCLDLPVYYLALAGLDDPTFQSLMKGVNQRCILLIEDIDRINFDQTKIDPFTQRPQISLSSLLNELDGLAAGDERIVIMTTNHKNRLDEALMRPGRIDVEAQFTYADEEVMCKMFLRFFKGRLKDPELEKAAKRFVEAKKHEKLSPAALQEHFQNWAEDPEAAISEPFTKEITKHNPREDTDNPIQT